MNDATLITLDTEITLPDGETILTFREIIERGGIIENGELVIPETFDWGGLK